MKPTSRRRPWSTRRRAEHDRGAVLVMVSISLVTIFGFVALTVDLGNAWQNRRGLVNASDAGALAAVQEYATGGDGCAAVAGAYVVSNKSDATMTRCEPSVTAAAGVQGTVTVEAKTTVNYFFAPILGIDNKVVSSSTTAKYGRPLGLFGLRPFGLCEDTLLALPEFQTFLASPGFYEALADTSDTKIARVGYAKTDPAACNDGDPVPGNWANIDFNGGANSTSEFADWVKNGYPDVIDRGVAYSGDTGSLSNTLQQELNHLVTSKAEFGLPLFDKADLSGSNARFHISGFVAVQVVGFKVSGNQSQRYLDLIFRRAILEGSCCYGGPDLDALARTVKICATDATDPAVTCAN